MLRLVNLELQKLLLNTASKVLIFISFILPFTVLILSSIKINFFGFFTLELGELGIFNFPIILSKKEFILSKFYTIVFFSFLATVLIGVGSFFIGLYYSSYNEAAIIFRETEFLLAYFVKLVGFFSLCLFFGMLVKRSAFALAFIFLLYIFEWIIFSIVLKATSSDMAWKVKNFLPLESMYKLIDQPFQRVIMTKYPEKIDMAYDYAVHWYEVVIVLGWTALFVFLSYVLLKQRDL